jgi:hypothetical protein
VRVVPAPSGRLVGFDRRPGRGSSVGRGRGFGRGGFGYWLGAFGGGLVDDPERHRDDGFFAGTGDASRVNGAAAYDYDRTYPYDWYRDDEATVVGEGPRSIPAPRMRCDVSPVPGGSSVRVCRGRR